MGSGDRDVRQKGDPSDWLWQLADSHDVGLVADEYARSTDGPALRDVPTLDQAWYREPQAETAAAAAPAIRKYRRKSPNGARGLRPELVSFAATETTPHPAQPGELRIGSYGSRATGVRKHPRRPQSPPLLADAATAEHTATPADAAFSDDTAVSDDTASAEAIEAALVRDEGVEVAASVNEPNIDVATSASAVTTRKRYLTLWGAPDDEPAIDTVGSDPAASAEWTPDGAELHQPSAAAPGGIALEDFDPEAAEPAVAEAARVIHRPAAPRVVPPPNSRHRGQSRTRHDGTLRSRAGAIAAAVLIVVGGAGITRSLAHRSRPSSSFQANVQSSIPPTTAATPVDATLPSQASAETPATAPPPTASGTAAALAAAPPAAPTAAPTPNKSRAQTPARHNTAPPRTAPATPPPAPAVPAAPVMVFASSPGITAPPPTVIYTPFPPTPQTTTTAPPMTTTTVASTSTPLGP